MAVRPYSEYLSDANGDHAAAAAAMHADFTRIDGQYESTNAQLTTVQSELQTARAQTVLQDGQVAISAVDSQLLTQYREMGTPDEWTQLQSNHTQMQREQTLHSVAGVMGWRPDSLVEIDTLKGAGLTYTIEGEGEQRQVFVIDAESQRTELSAYATANWGPLRGALSGDGKSSQQGTTWGNQQSGGGNEGGGSSVLDSYLSKRNGAGKKDA